VLKDISALLVGAAAFLYALGYTVHLAYFRVLGIETVGEPLDYVRFAADYVASMISSVPLLLFGSRYYLLRLFHMPFLPLTLVCIGIIILLAPRWIRERETSGKALKRFKHLTFIMLNLSTIVALALLLQMEFNIVQVRDVLQTVDTADVQQMQTQLTNPDIQKWNNEALLDLKKKNVGRIYSKYIAAHPDTPGFHYWNEWFNPMNGQGSISRSRTYLALLLINLIVSVTAACQLVWLKRWVETKSQNLSLKARWPRLKRYWGLTITLTLVFGIITQVFIFPYIYATVGRYFVYPIVRLRLRNDAQLPQTARQSPGTPESMVLASTENRWTHPVYLVSQSDSEVVVYDRLNFFQIKHVPKNRVLAMSQLFNASPFESCDPNEMTPCETLWIPEDTSTLDF
jgi:hypothetical protein